MSWHRPDDVLCLAEAQSPLLMHCKARVQNAVKRSADLDVAIQQIDSNMVNPHCLMVKSIAVWTQDMLTIQHRIKFIASKAANLRETDDAAVGVEAGNNTRHRQVRDKCLLKRALIGQGKNAPLCPAAVQ